MRLAAASSLTRRLFKSESQHLIFRQLQPTHLGTLRQNLQQIVHQGSGLGGHIFAVFEADKKSSGVSSNCNCPLRAGLSASDTRRPRRTCSCTIKLPAQTMPPATENSVSEPISMPMAAMRCCGPALGPLRKKGQRIKRPSRSRR